MALDPDDKEPRRLLAIALHMSGRDDEAEAELGQLVTRYPNDAECHHNLGLYLNQRGRLADAEICFRRALKLRPNWPPALNGLGQVFLRAEHLGKASNLFRRADRLARREPEDDGPLALRDAALAEGIAEDGLSATPLSIPGDGDAQFVHFPHAIVERSMALPICPSGRFFSRAFAYMHYPDKYGILWRAETAAVVARKQSEVPDFDGGLLLPNFFGNYGHWLLDVLPCLLALKSMPRQQPIRVIVDSLPPWKSRSLSRFAQRHELPDIDITVVDQPFYSVRGAHAVTRMARPAQVAALRALRPERRSKGLLFVMRRGVESRRLLNEDEVAAALNRLGFAAIDPAELTFDEQMELFARARIVVGVQGAALANCLFCRPSTPVIVLYAGRLMPFYCDLATHIPLRLMEIAGTIDDIKPDRAPEHCDFFVAADAVAAAAENALANAR